MCGVMHERVSLDHCDLTANDNRIVTADSFPPSPSVTPANWLKSLLDPNHANVKHPLYLSWPSIFSLHASTSPVDLRVGPCTLWGNMYNRTWSGRRAFTMHYT